MPSSTTQISATTNSASASLVSRISDLVSFVVIQFREPVREHCVWVHDIATKLEHARHALRSFQAHKTNGTYPPAIKAIKVPICQTSKDALEAGDVNDHKIALTSKTIEHQDEMLVEFINIKDEEVKYLQSLLPGKEKFIAKVEAQWAAIKTSTGGEEDPALKKEKDTLVQLYHHYSLRAQQLAVTSYTNELNKRNRKIEAEAAAKRKLEDDAKDLTVNEAVELALAKYKATQKSMQGQKRKRQDESCELNPHELRTNLTFESQAKQKTQDKFQHETQEKLAGEEKHPEKESRQEGKRRKIQEEMNRLFNDKNKSFDVHKGYTYPESFTEVSEHSRKMFVMLHTDVKRLDTLRRFSPGVHKLPGITMPGHIEYFLSLNLKYLFHQSPDLSLPLKAFKLLTRSIRIKWMMRNKNDKNFNPKFYVKNTEFIPDKAHPAIENGIRKGKEELLRQLNPEFLPSSTELRDRTNPGVVKQFMTENRLLACITDKNLGIAIVTKEWYQTQIMVHLLDITTYKKVLEVPTLKIYNCLNEVFEVWEECFTGDMANFVTHSETDNIPEFYGIPKIHKTPWKLRPIVPNMKWVTNNAAKVVDHHLQPLLQLFPWVLSSTRQFCKAISELPTGTHTRLRTGDVTAMYTNIPRRELLSRISKILERHPEAYPEPLRIGLIRLIELINDACFFSYQGELYWQKRGLAMGVACAPVLAQLYLAYQEEKRLPKMYREGLLYYGRYIDDTITVVSREFPLSKVQKIAKDQYLETIWSHEGMETIFLDTTVFVRGGRPFTKVFQKQMNHYQYIPWHSAHPKNVKKAFVKGELLRYNAICSFKTDYQEAQKSLFDHLRARGYPAKILAAWKQMIVPGEERFSVKGKNQELPWMLPSHYNPAWDLVHVKTVQKAMIEEWSRCKDIRIPEFSGKRMITSFKRTVSLYDQVRQWNKVVLMEGLSIR